MGVPEVIHLCELLSVFFLSQTSKACLSSKKSHYHPKKSKFSLKSKKKIQFFFFFDPFCYKNVDKMFHQPQKSPFSLQKVKKVKKSKFFKFFYFFTYCVKNILFLIIFGFGPLTPSIN